MLMVLTVLELTACTGNSVILTNALHRDGSGRWSRAAALVLASPTRLLSDYDFCRCVV